MAEGRAHRAGRIAGIAAAAVVVVFFAASFAFDRVQLAETYARTQPAELGLMPTYDALAEGHPRAAAQFQMDGQTLRGYVYEAAEPKGLVVFRHGIGSSHTTYLALICALVDRGWNVFAYDALGCGESDGDDIVGMPQSALDVAAAVAYARESGMADGLPLALWGHSWGGYGVAAALDIVPDVDACVTMSGFDDPCGVIFEWTDRIVGPVGVTQRPTLWLNNKLAFGADADRTAVSGINKTSAPVLVVHGTGDAVVEHDRSAIIAQRDRITNPNVMYLEPDEPGRDGHNSYFYTEESSAYLVEKSAEREALLEEHPDGVPDDVAAAFFADFDVRRANEADPELIDAIDSFLAEHLSTGGF